jgi:urease accessory protein
MTHLRQTPAARQSSKGLARIALRDAAGQARLTDLRQEGSAKVILPRAGALAEVVFLNTSGGLTGGDRLSYALDLGPNARAVATTQTAERAYRAGDGVARVDVSLMVGDCGWLDWLPQETILFDGAALDRRTVIRLGKDAGVLALEAVILGRAAMGEVVRKLAFRDLRRIERGGKLLHLEPLALDDATLGGGRAVLNGARAFASLILVAPDAGDRLAALRTVLDEPGVDAAASSYDGRLAVRMLARDGLPLRRQIARALAVLRPHPLPRVWQN